MVTSHDEDLANRMRIPLSPRHQPRCVEPLCRNGKCYYEVVDCGFKYNLSDIQAAIGIAQLHKQEELLKGAHRVRPLLSCRVRRHAGIRVAPRFPHSRHAWHLYSLRFEPGRG